MTTPAPMEVRVLGAADWAVWRDIRLRSLQESPGAFGSTYAREQGFADQVWRDRLADPGSVCVLVDADGSPVGMGGGFVDLPGQGSTELAERMVLPPS